MAAGHAAVEDITAYGRNTDMHAGGVSKKAGSRLPGHNLRTHRWQAVCIGHDIPLGGGDFA